MRKIKSIMLWLVAMSLTVTILPSSVLAATVGTLEGWTVTGDGTIELSTGIVSSKTKPILQWNRTAGGTTTLSYDLGILEAGKYKVSVTAKLPGDHGSAAYGLTEDISGELPQGLNYFSTSTRDIEITDSGVNQSLVIKLDGGNATTAYIAKVSVTKRVAEEELSDELLAMPDFDSVPSSKIGVDLTSTGDLKLISAGGSNHGWGWTSYNRAYPRVETEIVNGQSRNVLKFYPLANNGGVTLFVGDVVNSSGTRTLTPGTYEVSVTYNYTGNPGDVRWGLRYDKTGSEFYSSQTGEWMSSAQPFTGGNGQWVTATERFVVDSAASIEENGIIVESDGKGSTNSVITFLEGSIKRVESEAAYGSNMVENDDFAVISAEDRGVLDGWTVTGDGTGEIATNVVNNIAKAVLKWNRTAGGNTTLKYHLGQLEPGTYDVEVIAKMTGEQGTASYGITSDMDGVLLAGTGYTMYTRKVTVADSDAATDQYFMINLDGGTATECYVSYVSVTMSQDVEETEELLAMPNFDSVPSSKIDVDLTSSYKTVYNGTKNDGWGWSSVNRAYPRFTKEDVNGTTKTVLKFYPLENGQPSVVVGDVYGRYLEEGTYEAKITYKYEGAPGNAHWGLRYDATTGRNSDFYDFSSKSFIGSAQTFDNSGLWITQKAKFTVDSETTDDENGIIFQFLGDGYRDSILTIAEASLKKAVETVEYENLISNSSFSLPGGEVEFTLDGSTLTADIMDANNGSSSAKYLKFEGDIYYGGNGDTVSLTFTGDAGTYNILSISSSNSNMVLGYCPVARTPEKGWYHVEAELDLIKSHYTVNVVTPDDVVLERGNPVFAGSTTCINAINISTTNTISSAEEIVENAIINTSSELDLPVIDGLNLIIYSDGELISDKSRVPSTADEIAVDLETPLLKKSELDEVISLVDENGNVITPNSTSYSYGVYSMDVEGLIKEATRYSVIVDGSLSVSTGVTLGCDFAMSFKTANNADVEVSDIKLSDLAVTGIDKVSTGDNVSVAVDYKNVAETAEAFTVLAAYYNTAGVLASTDIVSMQNVSAGVSSKSYTYDYTLGDLTDIAEIRFFIWDTVNGLVPLADRYIIGDDTTPVTDGSVMHLTTSFYEDAKTSRGFAWQSTTAHSDMVVQYAKASDIWSVSKKSVSSRYTSYTQTSHGGTLYFHKAEITDLEPGTTYIYRIGDTADNVWSDFYTIKTEPEKLESFKFIAYTDPQADSWDEGYNVFNESVNTIFSAVPEAAFVVSTGDCVNDGDDWSQWKDYLRAVNGVIETVPHVTAVGNHDARAASSSAAPTTAQKYFSMVFNHPDNGANALGDLTTSDVPENYSKGVINNFEDTAYSFDYGDVHIAVLNTSGDAGEAGAMAILAKEVEWLKKDMAASDAKWKIVALHIALYPAITTRWNTCDELYAAMDELGIDLVFQGHDHFYTRTYPMKNNQIAETSSIYEIQKGTGTVYALLGSVGHKRHNDYAQALSADYTAVQYSSVSEQPCYTVVEVTGDKLEVVTKQVNGAVIDSFAIVNAE